MHRLTSLRLSVLTALLGLGVAACGDGDEVPATPPLTVVKDRRIDGPLTKATAEELETFRLGDALFDLTFRPADGLGPLFIRNACSACHRDGANGPGAVTKMAYVPLMNGGSGSELDFLPYGHTSRPQLAAGALTPILPPSGNADILTTLRLGPPIFGRGYMEAVADSEIERVEAEQAAGGEISGRIHRVRYESERNADERFHRHGPGDAGIIGRFGFKARIATLDDFSADAFQSDMGLTTPLRPNELPNPDGLTDDNLPGIDVPLETMNLVSDYVRLLEMPTRRPVAESARGETMFRDVGCAGCHVPTLRTRDDYPIAALAGIDAPIYSDLLLHDLGEGLTDGLTDGGASATEWKTAPLIGLQYLRSYLHDGRAKTLEDAVVLHDSPGSEASSSVRRFRELSDEDRRALLAFLSTL